VMKVLLVGELLTLSTDANMRGGGVAAAADEFNLCPAATKPQRYLDSLYRCHPGKTSSNYTSAFSSWAAPERGRIRGRHTAA